MTKIVCGNGENDAISGPLELPVKLRKVRSMVRLDEDQKLFLSHNNDNAGTTFHEGAGPSRGGISGHALLFFLCGVGLSVPCS